MQLRALLPLIAIAALLAAVSAAPALGSAAERGAVLPELMLSKKASKKAKCAGKKGATKGKKASRSASAKDSKNSKQKKGAKKGRCAGKKGSTGRGPVGGEPPLKLDAPRCDKDAGKVCYLEFELVSASPLTGTFCDSFNRGSGSCIGWSRGSEGWHESGYTPKYGIGTWLSWTDPGGARDVDISVKASFTISQASIQGYVPGPGSASFTVTNAWNRQLGVNWKTVDEGGRPGQLGGPLYIDYEWRTLGSSVNLWGYIVRK